MMEMDGSFSSVRRATKADIDTICSIYEGARTFMHTHGNPTQWPGTYPGRPDAEADLAAGHLWVLDEGEGPVGVMAVMPGPDPTYARIEGMSWLDEKPYWVMHRMATVAQGHGRGARMLTWLVARHDNVRADTHADNWPMQHALERAGFSRRGTIRLADGSPRVAYHFVRRG